MTPEPWTFRDLEMHQEECWEIYDPNTAQLVATFHDRERAQGYLDWINEKQAEKREKKGV
jgi:hypothetical protein